jgi:DNA modification methylase
MKYQILHGDNRETLKTLPDNSIDAIVTDPPYGIDFLGKDWDANTGALETYQECLRVLKPGGHILAFSAARTYHHLAVTLEAAGFEIRDQIMWIYSSGFPKSQDVGKSIARSEKKVKNTKTYLPEIDDNRNVANSTTGSPRCQMCDKSTGPIWKKCPDDRADCIRPWQADRQDNEWNGWGTQLKPAHEPIALARKPIKLSIARNCQTHGVGALNIDACRVPYESVDDYDTYINNLKGPMERSTAQAGDGLGMFENQTGFKAQKGKVVKSTKPNISKMGTTAHDNYNAEKNADEGLREGEQLPWIPSDAGRFPSNVLGEIPDYQKYFYCPKVSRRERHIGFEDPGPMFSGPRFDVYMPTAGKTDPTKSMAAVGAIFDQGAKIATEDKKGNGLDRVCETCGVSIMKPQDCRCDVKSWVRPIKTGNNHPTVKPIELMKYLIRLITPAGGTVLDPFNGSGSTGCAAVEMGMTYIGCELDERYVDIASRRIEAWYEHCNPTMYNQLFEQAA